MLALILACLTPSLGDTSRPSTSVRDVAAAWAAAGAEPGWMGRTADSPELVFRPDRESLLGDSALPAFRFRRVRPGMFDQLPAPVEAFGVVFDTMGPQFVNREHAFTPALARSLGRFRRLAGVAFVWTPVSAEAIRALAAVTRLDRLKLLDVETTGDAFAAACLPSLTWFEASALAGVGDKAASALARMRALERLALRDLPHDPTGHLKDLPRLASVSLRNVPLTDRGLAALAAVKTLASLELGNVPLTDREAARFAAATGLAELTLWGVEIGDKGLSHLAGLSRLERLYLDSRSPSLAGLKSLAGRLPGLKRLMVNVPGDAADLGVLAAFPGLEHLTLSAPGEDRPPLKNFPELRSLRRLAVIGCRLDAKSLNVVARLPGLRVLRLEKLDGDGLRGLTRLAGLEVLTLNGEIGDADAPAFATFPRLRKLHIGETSITGAGLSALVPCRRLTSLTLANDLVCDAGLRHVARLRALSSLSLTGGKVGDDGMKALASMRGLSSLAFLAVALGDDAPSHLVRMRGLRFLLLVGSGGLGGAGGEESLRRAMPRCDLHVVWGPR